MFFDTLRSDELPDDDTKLARLRSFIVCLGYVVSVDGRMPSRRVV